MTLRELLKQNELHFPLMRIPYHTSLSEISEAVSKYVYGINEEHNTQLLYTLETYFNNCQNSVKTSKALFIHRNTLLYRLDRIAEILDARTTDCNRAFICLYAVYHGAPPRRGCEKRASVVPSIDKDLFVLVNRWYSEKTSSMEGHP